MDSILTSDLNWLRSAAGSVQYWKNFPAFLWGDTPHKAYSYLYYFINTLEKATCWQEKWWAIYIGKLLSMPYRQQTENKDKKDNFKFSSHLSLNSFKLKLITL